MSDKKLVTPESGITEVTIVRGFLLQFGVSVINIVNSLLTTCVTSVTNYFKNTLDTPKLEEVFVHLQCSGCGRILTRDAYTYDKGEPICFRKIEAKNKKKWICPKQSKFAENDEEPFCTVTGAIIGNPEQCTPECDLLQG